jgi:hypothetical protein
MIMTAALGKPIVCPVLIGRGAYLASMRRCIDKVSAGAGQLVLPSGEAGIGKSLLRGGAPAHLRTALAATIYSVRLRWHTAFGDAPAPRARMRALTRDG